MRHRSRDEQNGLGTQSTDFQVTGKYMKIEAIAMDERTRGACVGSGWDHSEEKMTCEKKGQVCEVVLLVTWSGHYFSLQFPDHLIPHDIQLHVTLPPTPWPHTGLVSLWTVPYQNLSLQRLTFSLMPSLPLYLLFTLKMMLVPWPLPPPSFFQSINCLVDPWTTLSPTPQFPGQ